MQKTKLTTEQSLLLINGFFKYLESNSSHIGTEKILNVQNKKLINFVFCFENVSKLSENQKNILNLFNNFNDFIEQFPLSSELNFNDVIQLHFNNFILNKKLHNIIVDTKNESNKNKI